MTTQKNPAILQLKSSDFRVDGSVPQDVIWGTSRIHSLEGLRTRYLLGHDVQDGDGNRADNAQLAEADQ